MSWALSCDQYSLKPNSTRPGNIPSNKGRHPDRKPHGPLPPQEREQRMGKTTPFGPRMLAPPRSDGGCLRHHYGTAVSALATQRSPGKDANGGHGPPQGARCPESIALAFEPGQGPRVPNRMYQNERFCRPPIDLLLQWQARRTLHNRVMRALEPKKAARYLQLESKIRAIQGYDIAATIPLIK